jgi:hypothetical protein
MRLHPIILSSVTCPVLQHFSTLSRKRHDFRKTIFSTILSEIFLILRRHKRDMIKNVYRSASCKVQYRYSYPILMKPDFSKYNQVQISWKSVQWEPSCSLRTDGRRDRHDEFLISNFRRVLNVVCFHLGNSPASEVYMPTFRNTVPSSQAGSLPACEDGTECSETSAYKLQMPGNYPKESIQD